ncbi:hypothetical protein NA78x_004259 [Anatilimnocola sp. NA78]|uniref:hypothetical protein n=1 Tax=Anatilimnocola sp. NA78 TaxID=3415683 RepID=UPI003CE47641
MSQWPVRVVKVGGSLFDTPDLRLRLQAWLCNEPPAVNVLVAGGGELAECIRRWDARFSLGEERSHWLCIELLAVSAKVLSDLLIDCRWVTQFCDLQRLVIAEQDRTRREPIVFDLQQFLRELEPQQPPEPVPHNWSVTTDSLAARLAEVLQADELVLLKSVLPSAAMDDFEALCAAGYVDGYFPRIASRVKCVRFAQVTRSVSEGSAQ